MRSLHAVRDVDIVELRTLARAVHPTSDARALGELLAIIRRFRPDVVHTHLAKAGALGRVAAAVSRTPVIVHTFHGNVLHGYFGPLRSAGFRSAERALARFSTAIVAISPRQRAELERLRIVRPPQLVEIPLGLDLAPYRSPQTGSLRKELGVGSVPLVGIVARLVPIKRIDVLLRAVVLARVRVPDVHVVVIGDGELRPELELLARDLGIHGVTHFLGWRSDLPAIYADLDLVALTSDNEGFPVSLIEAMTAGRPVVATNVGGVGDLVSTETGVLVPAGDTGALASAFVRLLGDPAERKALGIRGAARAYPEHDASTLVARVAALYRALLGT